MKKYYEVSENQEKIKIAIARAKADAEAIVGRRIKLVIDPTVPHAHTDALSVVHLNPRPFLEGKFEIGEGIVCHEAGHCRYSSSLVSDLQAKAKNEGGEALWTICNLLVDRKDDTLVRRDFPGFRIKMWKRLGYVLPPFEKLVRTYPGHELPQTPPESIEALKQRLRVQRVERRKKPKKRIMRHRKADNALSDFFYACKKHLPARYPETFQAMEVVKELHLSEKTSSEEILHGAKRILELLKNQIPFEALDEQMEEFLTLALMVAQAEFDSEHGPQLSPAEKKIIEKILRQIEHEERFVRQLSDPASGIFPMGANLPVGGNSDAEYCVEQVEPDAECYAEVRENVEAYIPEMRRVVDIINETRIVRVGGERSGKLDLRNTAKIAAKRDDVYYNEYEYGYSGGFLVVALDQSGSMGGKAIEKAKELAVLLNEAILSPDYRSKTGGHVLGFDDVVYDYGEVAVGCGVAKARAQGSTNEHFAIRRAQEIFARAKTRFQRLLLLVICDGASNNPMAVEDELAVLHSMGVVTVRILVGGLEDNSGYRFKLSYEDYDSLIANLRTFFEHFL